MPLSNSDIFRKTKVFDIDAAEISEQTHQSLQFFSSVKEPIRETTIQEKGKRIRFIHNGNQSFLSFSLGQTGAQSFQAFANRLLRMEPTKYLMDLPSTLTSASNIDLLHSPTFASPTFCRAWLTEIREALSDRRIMQYSKITITLNKSQRILSNSVGADITEAVISVYGYVHLNFPSGVQQTIFLSPLLNLEKEIERQLRHTSYKSVNSSPSGTFPIVLSPKCAWVLMHEVLGHHMEADSIIEGYSNIADLVGHPIASTELTVVNDPNDYDLLGFRYDDEGSKGRGTVLVEEGILNEYMHSNETSLLFDTHTTGNFLSASPFQRPQVRQSYLFVEPKNHDDEDLIEVVENGLYLNDCKMGISYISGGRYYLSIRNGRYIRNGKLAEGFGECKVVGLTTNTLHNILGIGKRSTTFRANCIKHFEEYPVMGASPAIAINDMEVI